jgi:hypothetical protein
MEDEEGDGRGFLKGREIERVEEWEVIDEEEEAE